MRISIVSPPRPFKHQNYQKENNYEILSNNDLPLVQSEINPVEVLQGTNQNIIPGA